MNNFNHRNSQPHYYPHAPHQRNNHNQNNAQSYNMYQHQSRFYNQQQFRPHNNYNNSRQNTYNPENNPYSQQNFRGNKRKDLFNENANNKTKPKKNKTLGRHNPTKSNFTQEEVEKALKVEKEHLKPNNVNLMVRFPDPEINKEIVLKIHPAFKDVSFAQSSNARSCFVTLKDNADGNKTIKELNETKFGLGCLTAEFKKENQNDDHNEDLDPLRLFVGNLPKSVIKSDILKIFPQQHRIDIGFSRQRPNTRYAKVQFKTVDQAIEAYKCNVRKELHGKSLILRFYRFSDDDDKSDHSDNRKDSNLNPPISTLASTSSIISDENSSNVSNELQNNQKTNCSTSELNENILNIKQEPEDDLFITYSDRIDPLAYNLNCVKEETI